MTDNWQSIDSAPRDETSILVWGSFGPRGEDCMIAAWYDRSEEVAPGLMPNGPYVWALVGADQGMYARDLAKLWRPLPPSPTT